MAMDNLQPLCYAIISIAFAVGTSTFFLRFYSRQVVMHAFGWDDIFSIFLLVVSVGQQTALYMFLQYGGGKHLPQLSAYELEKLTLYVFIEQILYMFTHWTIKQTFLIFYLRLSPSQIFRQCVFVTMGINAAVLITNWLLAFLQCSPFLSIIYPQDYPDSVCISTIVVMMVPPLLNVVTDLIILILPIPTIWMLNLSLRRKVAVLGMLSFGASSVIIAFCRFIVLYNFLHRGDSSWVIGEMVIVAGLEINCAIVAVNLPSMGALFTSFGGWRSTGGGGGGGDSDSDGRAGEEQHNNKIKTRTFEFELSAVRKERRRKKHNMAGPVADIGISNLATTEIFAGTISEEELCSSVH